MKINKESLKINFDELGEIPTSDIRQIVDEGWEGVESGSLRPFKILSELFGMTILSLTVQPFVTPTIAVAIVSESAERFNAANGAKLPILDQNKMGVDLTKIKDYKSFRDLCTNGSGTRNFCINQWLELKERQKNYRANSWHQAAALAIRNNIFSSAIFMAQPWAAEIVEKHEKSFAELGVKKENAIEVLTYGIHATLAWMTTPVDRVFSQFSSGEKTAPEIMVDFFKDVKSANFKRLFAGATTRSFVCLLASATLAEGARFSALIGDLMSPTEEPILILSNFKIGKFLVKKPPVGEVKFGLKNSLVFRASSTS